MVFQLYKTVQNMRTPLVPALPQTNLKNCTGANIFAELNWYQLYSALWLEGGDDTRGVAAIEILPMQVVLIKWASSIASEMLCNYLASNFLDLQVPAMRFVEYCPFGVANEEWRAMASLDQAFDALDNRRSKLSNGTSRAFVAIIEFVPGIKTYEVLQESEQVQQQIADAELVNVQYWHDLGKIIVLDMLINNSDRLPGLLWQNDGNLSNLILNTSSCRMVPIDSTGSAIMLDKQKQIYKQKVATLIKQMMNAKETQNYDHLAGMCEAMYMMNGFVIPEKAKIGIVDGFLHAFAKCATVPVEKLVEYKSQLEQLRKSEDYQNQWQFAMKQVHVEFIIEMIQFVAVNCIN